MVESDAPLALSAQSRHAGLLEAGLEEPVDAAAGQSQLEVAQRTRGADGRGCVEAQVVGRLSSLEAELVALALGRDDNAQVAFAQIDQLLGRGVGDLDSADAPAHVVASEAVGTEAGVAAERDLGLAKARLRQRGPLHSALSCRRRAGDGVGGEHALDKRLVSGATRSTCSASQSWASMYSRLSASTRRVASDRPAICTPSLS
eukprot:2727817-Prymnesium_polylepis.2